MRSCTLFIRARKVVTGNTTSQLIAYALCTAIMATHISVATISEKEP